jgi:hypothetical protein
MTRLSSIPPGSPEATSRRSVLRVAAGLGAVGLGAALADPREAEAKTTDITVPPASERNSAWPFQPTLSTICECGLPQPAGRRRRRSATGPKACLWRR